MSIHILTPDSSHMAREALRKTDGITCNPEVGLDTFVEIAGVREKICLQIKDRGGDGSECGFYSTEPSDHDAPLEDVLEQNAALAQAIRAFVANLTASEVYNGEHERINL